ncbi:MAG: porin family protein [Bauldia sp.]|nr:porin family protein [Bauldia sp.]
MKRLLAAAGLAATLVAACAGVAHAQYVWDGPRLTEQAIFGVGTANYVFNTDGYYNDAQGDTFSHPVRGFTFGIGGGYDWQIGPVVYGIDMTVISGNGGVGNYDVQSPYDPNQGFELKFHWATTVSARVGFALDRTLFYVQAGTAFTHLINEANDEPDRVRLGRWPLGVSAGFGVERAVTDRMALGVGYRFLAFAPFSIVSNGATPTDHTVQYRAHLVQTSVTWRFDQPEDVRGKGLEGFGWAGPYVGVLYGSPSSFHAVAGYNLVLADRFLFGPEVRGALFTCCNLRYGADVMARAGLIIDEHLLVYAEAGLRWRDTTRFVTAGGGMEIAMSPRFSGVMELSALHKTGGGWGEVSFMGGLRLHLGGNALR